MLGHFVGDCGTPGHPGVTGTSIAWGGSPSWDIPQLPNEFQGSLLVGGGQKTHTGGGPLTWGYKFVYVEGPRGVWVYFGGWGWGWGGDPKPCSAATAIRPPHLALGAQPAGQAQPQRQANGLCQLLAEVPCHDLQTEAAWRQAVTDIWPATACHGAQWQLLKPPGAQPVGWLQPTGWTNGWH